MTDSDKPHNTPIEDSEQEIQGSFTAAQVVRSNVDYKKPEGDAIIQGARDILKQSPTGLRLIQMADGQGIVIKVLKGKNEGVFTPDGRNVILTLHPQDKVATAKHAFVIAYGIRQCEQNLLGFSPPSKDSDPQGHVNMAFGKNLDALKNVFQIYDDLQSVNGIMNLFDTLDELQVGYIYQQYKDGLDDFSLTLLLVKNIEELQQKKEG